MATKKKVALVTGCGKGGIGEALVVEYKRQGLRPIATLLPFENSQHLDDAGIVWFPLDVTKEDSVRELKNHMLELTGGSLDVLVNNAGICYTMTAIDTDVAAVTKMFDVNVFGAMRMVHHFHDMLIQSSGTIVSIGSVGGIVPYVYGSAYNATKAALHHWSNTLRVEMEPLGVKVITIISGNIGTNILKGDQGVGRELRKGSYFAPLAQEFKDHVNRVPDTTDRFEYAFKVVQQSLRSAPPAWFWYGKTTWIVRFLDTFAWRKVWDGFMWNMFNFQKLQAARKSL